MRYLVPVIPLVVAVVTASEQPPAQSAGPSFEVASIKPNASGGGSMSVGWRGDRWVVVNGTPFTLVMNAYRNETFNILGAPGWTRSERYDITAKSSLVNPTPEQYQALVKAFLIDRFKLAAHTEMRELPTYRLVKARSDGQLGPRIRRTDVDCQAIRKGSTDTPPAISPVTGGPVCGGRGGMGLYAMSAVTMPGFARSLAYELERNVIDATGVEGQYDVLLQWTQDRSAAAGSPEEFGSIFTALQEQLGLKLDAQRASVEVLVIDRIERPSEN